MSTDETAVVALAWSVLGSIAGRGGRGGGRSSSSVLVWVDGGGIESFASSRPIVNDDQGPVDGNFNLDGLVQSIGTCGLSFMALALEWANQACL
jgi:hypothetical protein